MTSGAPLRELGALVVDCQTTGATPTLGHVIELAFTILSPPLPVTPATSTRVALPEGATIPRIIAKLTGLSRESARAGVSAEEAYRAVREAARAIGPAPVPTVIHFARFEMEFLRDLHARFGDREPLPFEPVCVHEIARRLFPDLPRRNLRALAGYFGHSLELERRAGAHVDATAAVWTHLAELLEREHGVGSLAELTAWLTESPAPRSKGRRAYPMARERQLALPNAPGVYRMRRSNGDLVYIGKATSLRQRVRSHFTQGKTSERALEMLTQVRDISVTETATVLEAALLEVDEIKRWSPPYNVQLRERSAYFASPDLEMVAERPVEPRWHGPLPSKMALSALGAMRTVARHVARGGSLTAVDVSLRARALGVPASFAPDPASFAEGFSALLERYVAKERSRTILGRLDKASLTLSRLLGEGVLEESGDEEGWDPERVRRHLERGLAQGGQILRRARLLIVLADSVVAFTEKRRPPRCLHFEAGLLARAEPFEEGAALARPRDRAGLDKLGRKARFDGESYDRLRVLVTELKRVLAEGGAVRLAVAPFGELRPEKVARLLRRS